MTAMILANARVVTRHETFLGSVHVIDGRITAVERGRTAGAGTLDLGGDYLVPGLVELHTDNLERQMMPRPGVRWPGVAAVVAHDGQCAAAGITTVLDALAVGDVGGRSERFGCLREMVSAVAQASRLGLLRAEHFLHLRLEVSYPKVVELFAALAGDPLVRLVSLMDHTPGQRLWRDAGPSRAFDHGQGAVATAVPARVDEQTVRAARHRDVLASLCRQQELPLASHGDASPQHVEDAARSGACISEFPTSLEAAEAARRFGLAVLVGAPNLVQGRSQYGNVAVHRLAAQGLIDVLSSDYYPLSLLHGAWLLHRDEPGFPLSEAVATVTVNPARRAGLDDRGVIAVGLRADLVRVRDAGLLPLVLAVWRAGERMA